MRHPKNKVASSEKRMYVTKNYKKNQPGDWTLNIDIKAFKNISTRDTIKIRPFQFATLWMSLANPCYACFGAGCFQRLIESGFVYYSIWAS